MHSSEEVTSEPQNSDRKNRSFASSEIELLDPLDAKNQSDLNGPFISQLIFQHIPKTGGTNVSFCLDAFSQLDSTFRATRFQCLEKRASLLTK
jgi:hypothetical protein